MKKIVTMGFVIVIVLMTALAGCGKKDVKETTSDQTKEKEVTSDIKDKDVEKDPLANINATGLPIVKEPVTLKVAAKKRETVKKPFKDLAVLQEIEAATNVHIEWDVAPINGWQEKKNLMLASGDWPDVFWGNYIIENNEVIKFAADGIFMPLEDLIDQHAPNIKKILDETPGLRDYITAPDGHIYALPSINETASSAVSAQFINQAWLDEVGMDIPTTTDELYDVLKAFKGICSNEQTPFTFRFDNNILGLNGMFGSFGLVDNKTKFTVVEDKVLFTPMEEAYKEAVQYFHRLFSEGLMDVESFSQNMPIFKAKVSNKNVGVTNMWSLNWLFGDQHEDAGYVFMPPLKGPKGHQGYMYKNASFLSGKGSFLITETCENPVVAIKWADYMAQQEVSFKLLEGLIYEKDDQGIYQPIPIPEGMSNDEFRHAETPGANSFHMLTNAFYENVNVSKGILEKRGYDKIYEQYKTNTFLPPFYLSPEDSSRIAELKGDILSFVNEKTSHWMLEGGIEKEWDSYIKQLKKMKIEEMLNIYQNRYNDFISE